MKIRTIKFATLFVYAILSPGIAWGGAPTCAAHSSGPYCQYEGEVRQAYVNSGNQVLLYFDTTMDLNEPINAGISGVTAATYAMFEVTTNPDFGKMLFSALLAAQARDATIIVQMRGQQGGVMLIDRIWVTE